MDLATHPAVVIISTVAAVVGVATTLWATLVYVRKRWIAPLFRNFLHMVDAAHMVPSIREQLFNNSGSTLRDMVDRIAAQLAVLRSQDTALMQEHEKGIFMTDETGRTVWVNRAYLCMLGVTEGQVLGYGWKNTVAHQERRGYITAWEEAIQDRREFEHVVTLRTEDGLASFSVRAYPVEQPYKGYIGFVVPMAATASDASI